MADLAVVALGLDATGMTSGAAQANRALQSVETEMSKAEKGTSQLAGALSGLGGPLGQAGSQLSGFSGQITSLTESFGVMGAATIGLVAGVASLAAGFAKLAIAGSKIADEMLDIAESTGLSVDQVQELSAAMVRSGESTQGVERAFRSFESAIVNAVRDPASDAAKNLKQLGIDAEEAGRDVQGAFIASLANLKEYRTTTEGAVATNELYGRGIGALVRGSGELNDILGKTRQELEDAGLVASKFAVDQAGKLDTSINRLTQSFETFQTVLNGIDGGAITGIFNDLAGSLETINGWLNRVGPNLRAFLNVPAISPILSGLGITTGVDFSGAPLSGPHRGADPTGTFGIGRGGGGGGGGGAVRAVVDDAAKTLAAALKDAERDNAAIRKTRNDALIKDLENLSTEVKQLTHDMLDVPTLRDTSGIGLVVGGAPPFSGGGIPGAPGGGALAPSLILSAREARIQAALGGIFEDFVFQITSARSTVGDAFKGLLLGITDTFAAEFAKAVQESLQTAFIRPLASWLEDALKGIFEGIDLKGVSKFFLTLGKSFVGMFAEGGTIPPGHWGIAGERGAEVVYSGSQSMHIQPMGGGGGGVTINFAISTPTGEVSQRTQDQIADAAARGIERSQRLRGAR